MKLLESLQIFGVSHENENAFLASMLLGEPSLLIGPPGSSKTELAKMIGQALREYSRKQTNNSNEHFSYQTYDASKVNFEDLIGYPNIEAIKENRVEFIRTPMTIWNKDLVVFDELNRCVRERQSNFFEVLRSRTLNGLPTNNKFIFSTMNPFGDTGTEEMSDALVDRHLFYIYFDKFSSMADIDKKAILTRIGESDAVGLRYWGGNREFNLDVSDTQVNEYLASIGEKIHQTLTRASEIYEEIKSELGPNMQQLVLTTAQNIISNFKGKDYLEDLDISGRRASMVYRAIIAYRAVEQAKSNIFGSKIKNLSNSIASAFMMSIPIGIASSMNDSEFSIVTNYVDTFINNNWESILTNSENIDTIYTLYNDKDPFVRFNILLSTDLDKLTNHDAWSRLVGTKNTEINNILASIKNVFPDKIPQHIDPPIDFNPESTNLTLVPVLEPHENRIKELLTQYQNDILLSILIQQAITFYNRELASSKDKLDAIVAMNTLQEAIYNVDKLINSDERQEQPQEQEV